MEILLDQLATLSHPKRMSVFRLLMRRFPDALSAGEIARVLTLKASTTSVYLSALTKSGLLQQTRQGTSLFYRLDLQAARGMVADLFVDCCGGRADLCPPMPKMHAKTRLNVLFLCRGNSARSIFAEAILRHEAGVFFNAFSAGFTPAENPDKRTIAVLEKNGITTAKLGSKPLETFQDSQAPVMDFVFTVCDASANEGCPPWAGSPMFSHWGLPDPVTNQGSELEQSNAFQQTFDALKKRILAFTALPLASLDRASLQTRLDTLGQDFKQI